MNPAARLPGATLGARALAALIDLALLGATALVLLVGAIEVGIGVTRPVADSHVLAATIGASPLLQAVPLVALGLLTAARLRFGTSVGHWLLGLRVVDLHDGAAPAWPRVLARLPLFVLTVLPAGIGLLWMRRDARGVPLHDRLTGTRVVAEDESVATLRELEAML